MENNIKIFIGISLPAVLKYRCDCTTGYEKYAWDEIIYVIG
jgi:hypothetical protein